MSREVTDLFSRRDSAPPAVPIPLEVGEARTAGGVVLTPPEQHLQWLMLEVAKEFEEGHWTRGVENLAHCVYVAATKGPQGLSDHELVQLIRRIVGYEFNPGGDAA